METYATRSPVVGLAALSLLESLLISLRERNVLSEEEVTSLKEDVIAAHRNAAATSDKPLHDAVADLVSGIGQARDGTYALRSPKG